MSSTPDTAAPSINETAGAYIPLHFKHLAWGDPDREDSQPPETLLEKVLWSLTSAIRSVCAHTAPSSAEVTKPTAMPVSMIDSVRQCMRRIMQSADQDKLEDSVAAGINAMTDEDRTKTLAELLQGLFFLNNIYGLATEASRPSSSNLGQVVFWNNARRNAKLSEDNERLTKELERTKADLEIAKTELERLSTRDESGASGPL